MLMQIVVYFQQQQQNVLSDLLVDSHALYILFSPCRYQHSRQLVMALNKFVDDEADVPEEWEKKLNKEGKVRGVTACECVHGGRGACVVIAVVSGDALEIDAH